MPKTFLQPAPQWRFSFAPEPLPLRNPTRRFENFAACVRLGSPSMPSINPKWTGVQARDCAAQLLPAQLCLDGLRAGSRQG